MDIQFEAMIFKEAKAFVAYCPELDVSSFGDTVDDARRMLKEAVALFLEEADQMGTLEQILEEAGYTPNDTKGKRVWEPPTIVSSERMEVQV